MKRSVALLCALLATTIVVAETNPSLPAGTVLKVKLEKTLSTFTVEGRVTKVNKPRRIAGKPTIGLFPETVILPNGERYMLNAPVIDTSLRNGTDVDEEGQFKGAGHDGKDLTEIGMGTGGGMLVGGLIGGGKGMLIGGTIAATATVAHWLGKRRSAVLPAGTELLMELSRPMAMTAAGGGGQ
ncbi:MAG: hypothetical protein DMG86_06485 [Acidobacteria bacterium]|nr:MAG: hypothetical protein DMG86_06485 [Acidobacteriota bacterium]